MTQRYRFVRHLSLARTPLLASAPSVSRDEMPLANASTGGIMLYVLLGKGMAQYLVEGHWVDGAAFAHGAVIMADDRVNIRFQWDSEPKVVALALSADTVAVRLDHIREAMRRSSVVHMSEDALTTSIAKMLNASTFQNMGEEVIANLNDVLVARIAELSRERMLAGPSRPSGLPQWRLRRVEALVRERIGEDISLLDMSSAAGLSPMHFAAQFKLATGMRPHQYLLTQRIEQAKLMLGNARCSICDVALSVGFQTHAHFAAVFKRMESTTPSRWRKVRLAA